MTWNDFRRKIAVRRRSIVKDWIDRKNSRRLAISRYSSRFLDPHATVPRVLSTPNEPLNLPWADIDVDGSLCSLCSPLPVFPRRRGILMNVRFVGPRQWTDKSLSSVMHAAPTGGIYNRDGTETLPFETLMRIDGSLRAWAAGVLLTIPGHR